MAPRASSFILSVVVVHVISSSFVAAADTGATHGPNAATFRESETAFIEPTYDSKLTTHSASSIPSDEANATHERQVPNVSPAPVAQNGIDDSPPERRTPPTVLKPTRWHKGSPSAKVARKGSARLPNVINRILSSNNKVDRGGTPHGAEKLKGAEPRWNHSTSTNTSQHVVPEDAAGMMHLLAGLLRRSNAENTDCASASGNGVSPSDGTITIRLPLTLVNVVSALLLLVLSLLGAVYLYKLSTQHVCACPLCTGKYVIEDKIGAGGFGSVYSVRIRHEGSHGSGRIAAWKRRLVGLLAGLMRSLGCGRWAPDDDPLAFALHAHPTGGGDLVDAAGGASAFAGLADLLFKPDVLASPPPPSRFVLKMIPVEDINDASEAQREARDLRYLRHPRIVRYFADWLHSTPAGAGRDASLYVCIVMERCQTDLRRLIQRHRKQHRIADGGGNKSRKSRAGDGTRASGSFDGEKPHPVPVPEAFIIKVAAQLVSALKYCHSKGIVHRDVKSQNVFLTESDDVRLGDFGLARYFDRALQSHPLTVHTDAGTDCYKAPEQFLSGRRDGRKGDVWSLGIVLLEIATQKFAWEGAGLGAQLVPGDEGQPPDMVVLDRALQAIPACYSPSLRRLIRRCLIPDQAARPSAEELLGIKILRRALASKPAATSAATPAIAAAVPSVGSSLASGSSISAAVAPAQTVSSLDSKLLHHLRSNFTNGRATGPRVSYADSPLPSLPPSDDDDDDELDEDDESNFGSFRQQRNKAAVAASAVATAGAPVAHISRDTSSDDGGAAFDTADDSGGAYNYDSNSGSSASSDSASDKNSNSIDVRAVRARRIGVILKPAAAKHRKKNIAAEAITSAAVPNAIHVAAPPHPPRLASLGYRPPPAIETAAHEGDANANAAVVAGAGAGLSPLRHPFATADGNAYTGSEPRSSPRWEEPRQHRRNRKRQLAARQAQLQGPGKP